VRNPSTQKKRGGIERERDRVRVRVERERERASNPNCFLAIFFVLERDREIKRDDELMGGVGRCGRWCRRLVLQQRERNAE
jgi:hypothetical protein